MRTMHDSVTVTDIPKTATMVAGYFDGHYANMTALKARFPKATHVSVTPSGQPGANVIDRETGDVTAAQAATWAANEIHDGRTPTIYVNASSFGEVESAVARRGLTGKVYYWIAEWTGKPHMHPGKNVVATQYADPQTSGGHYDLSLVADYWPGVDKVKPTPKPAAKTTPLNRVTRALIRKTTRLLERIVRRLAKRRRPTTPAGLGALASLATLCTEFLAEYERIKGIK